MFDVRSPWLGWRLAQRVCAVTGGDPGAVARQPIRAEPAAQLSGPLSRAPHCWRKYPEPCGREANQEKPSAEWAGGMEAGPRPLAAPSSSPRLLPQPLCLHTSIHSSYTPHPPKLTNIPPHHHVRCCRGGRLPSRCMPAHAGGPRHPGHKNTRIWAQHSSHPQRENRAPLTHTSTN